MDEELKIFIKVWVYAIISVTYCYYISSRIKTGVLRLLSIIPVCALLYLLPLFSSSRKLYMIPFTAFCLHANLKLFLFAFDQGPLFPLPSNLPRFICFTCLPVELQQNPKSHPSQNHFPKWVLGIKVAIFGVLLKVDCYNQPKILLLVLRPLEMYLRVELLFTLIKFLVSITLGCDLEPVFNEPYLATSLQDFWGRRWNLMVSSTLRSGVYTPVRRVCGRLMSSDRARLMGFFAAFIVSGASHELLHFYFTRETPSWELTVFFTLNGVCTAVEMAVKRTKFGLRWQVRPVVSWMLTMGFLVLTGFLFFPFV
ncbi:unnamed protein product [Microthlaspi erraticum]|uniref:Wax synthase domain-containing protein n=1 Tax=Microthlaspi erraticum TaxID=1685480 RepID=A0A6D2IL27_9BRAS|nr:unnamed protein product [Microthlaspi erraticum]CAA7025840.1 unnamed protein product [Microthlaspi erraticum]